MKQSQFEGFCLRECDVLDVMCSCRSVLKFQITCYPHCRGNLFVPIETEYSCDMSAISVRIDSIIAMRISNLSQKWFEVMLCLVTLQISVGCVQAWDHDSMNWVDFILKLMTMLAVTIETCQKYSVMCATHCLLVYY